MKIEIECTRKQFDRLVSALSYAAITTPNAAVRNMAGVWCNALDEGATFPSDYDGLKVEIIREEK